MDIANRVRRCRIIEQMARYPECSARLGLRNISVYKEREKHRKAAEQNIENTYE